MYNWNEEDSSTQRHLGFIAQEVEALIPELVATDSTTGKKSLNTTGLIPVLTRSIQDIMKTLGIVVENGVARISDFVAETVTAREVKTQKLCVGDRCITPSEFNNLLDKNNIGTGTIIAPALAPSSEVVPQSDQTQVPVVSPTEGQTTTEPAPTPTE